MRNKKSIVWRMTFFASILLLIAIIIVSIVYLITLRNSLNTEVKNRLNTSLNYIQRNIDISLSEAETIIHRLLIGIEFSYLLDGRNELSEGEINNYRITLDRDLLNIQHLHQNKYSTIGIYSSNPQLYNNHLPRQFAISDLEERSYWQEIANGGTGVTFGSIRQSEMFPTTLSLDSLLIGDSGVRVLPIYYKIFDRNNDQLVGVLEMNVDVIRLVEGFRDLDIENEMEQIILDSDFSFLYNSLPLSVEEKEIISEAVSKQQGNTIRLPQGRYFYTMTTLYPTDMIGVIIFPDTEFSANIRNSTIIIVVVTLLFWSILSLIFWRTVRNSLKSLVIVDRMLEKITKGEAIREIENDNRDDEVSRIVHSYNDMANSLTQVINEQVQKEQAQYNAELRALQAQINPHFLYNTLENLAMQCDLEGNEEIGENLSTLSDLFRYSISWGGNEVPLILEWQNLQDYLSIMKMRFDHHVQYDLFMEVDLEEIKVPKMILQPLVENTFNHGFKNKLPPWSLQVRAEKRDNFLVITINDNGNGMTAERLSYLRDSLYKNKQLNREERQESSIGLMNVHQRLKLICKQNSGLEINSSLGIGTTVVVRIDLK